MRQVIVGAVLLVTGVVLVSTGYRDALRDTDYVSNFGIAVVGTIVAVEGNEITIEFTFREELREATAHPAEPLPLGPGDRVGISVLGDDPSRIVIQGTEENPELISTAVLVLGAVSALAGAGMLMYHFLGTPVAGEFPRFHWTRERHGGA
jgi:hypothetical protein